MSGDGLDRYDVEAMIRDAGYDYAKARELEATAADLRSEIRALSDDIADLNEQIAALSRQARA